MALNKTLKVNSDAELLSFLINQDAELSSVIDLPTQGESLAKIGKIIMNNDRLKNAFFNGLNVIGKTLVQRNHWENPWQSFTNKGTLNAGQSVREIIVDIARAYDYNEHMNEATHFLTNYVPDVYNYLHDLNFQKFYPVTINETEFAMAFGEGEGTALMDLTERTFGSAYEGYEYDQYLVSKYMLLRRIVDGTVAVENIADFDTLTTREITAIIKGVSNKLGFRSTKYNPAGVNVASRFDSQIAILNTEYEAQLSTNVFATSFFRNDAEIKTRMALVDGFGSLDTARLIETLGTAYEAIADSDLAILEKVPAVLLDENFFQVYDYAPLGGNGTRSTEFLNPESLNRTLWLHAWKVMSTSPFSPCVVFLADEAPAVTEVVITPEEASISAGNKLQLTGYAVTTGFANKAVQYSIEEAPGETTGRVEINPTTGLLTIPSDYTPTSTEEANPIVVRATSIYDGEKYADAQISVL